MRAALAVPDAHIAEQTVQRGGRGIRCRVGREGGQFGVCGGRQDRQRLVVEPVGIADELLLIALREVLSMHMRREAGTLVTGNTIGVFRSGLLLQFDRRGHQGREGGDLPGVERLIGLTGDVAVWDHQLQGVRRRLGDDHIQIGGDRNSGRGKLARCVCRGCLKHGACGESAHGHRGVGRRRPVGKQNRCRDLSTADRHAAAGETRRAAAADQAEQKGGRDPFCNPT